MKFGCVRITEPDRAAKILQKLSMSNIEFQSVEFDVPIFVDVKWWKILNYNNKGIYLQGYIGEKVMIESEFFYFSEFRRGLLIWFTKVSKKSTSKIPVKV